MRHFLLNDSLPWRRRKSHETLSGFPVKRVVRAYEKEGEQLVIEFFLKDASLLELQNLFGESAQNLMVDCYPIAKTQADYIQQRLAIVLDFDAFDYFLECDAV